MGRKKKQGKLKITKSVNLDWEVFNMLVEISKKEDESIHHTLNKILKEYFELEDTN